MARHADDVERPPVEGQGVYSWAKHYRLAGLAPVAFVAALLLLLALGRRPMVQASSHAFLEGQLPLTVQATTPVNLLASKLGVGVTGRQALTVVYSR